MARAHGLGLSQFRALPSTDQMLALALEHYEADLCGGCGLPMHETMDPENERAYVAPEPVRCHACTARDKMADNYDEAKQRGALRFPVLKKLKRSAREPASSQAGT